MRRAVPLFLFLFLCIVAAACGSSRAPAAAPATTAAPITTTAIATRTVDVTMADIEFSVATIDVKVGETVRLAFHNRGKVPHEALLGDTAMQDAHEKEMNRMGAGAMGDMAMNDPNTVTVDPGATSVLTHTFKTAGRLLIGCHEPGHYAAGMKIGLNVS